MLDVSASLAATIGAFLASTSTILYLITSFSTTTSTGTSLTTSFS